MPEFIVRAVTERGLSLPGNRERATVVVAVSDGAGKAVTGLLVESFVFQLYVGTKPRAVEILGFEESPQDDARKKIKGVYLLFIHEKNAWVKATYAVVLEVKAPSGFGLAACNLEIQ